LDSSSVVGKRGEGVKWSWIEVKMFSIERRGERELFTKFFRKGSSRVG
jgi:hypothetical protein